MQFAHTDHVTQWQLRLQRFMDDLAIPAQGDWLRYEAAGVYPLDVIEPLKARARTLGLWSWGRSMRFLDGPDKVHLRNIAHAELTRAKTRLAAHAPHL
ncbi:hypothetical protein BH11PSE8_BH11PSE8_24640 [soil metagenome]